MDGKGVNTSDGKMAVPSVHDQYTAQQATIANSYNNAFDNADFRMNAEGVRSLMEDIKVYLIDNSVDEIKNEKKLLLSSMAGYWNGQGAEGFANYLDTEISKLEQELTDLRMEVENRVMTAAEMSAAADSSAKAYFDRLGGTQ